MFVSGQRMDRKWTLNGQTVSQILLYTLVHVCNDINIIEVKVLHFCTNIMLGSYLLHKINYVHTLHAKRLFNSIEIIQKTSRCCFYCILHILILRPYGNYQCAKYYNEMRTQFNANVCKSRLKVKL